MTEPRIIDGAWIYTERENECWIFTSGLVFVISPFKSPNPFYRAYVEAPNYYNYY